MKKTMLLVFTLLFIHPLFCQLRISADKRHLIRKDGTPFFWLGDTAWELFHRLNREEATKYLTNRAAKGFTVIQAVVLAELDGLNTPNVYGDKPLINNDPAKPNEAYFKQVDFIVDKAEKLGLIIAMLPAWGDKWNKKWGTGPEVFTPANAAIYGEWLGRRYKNKPVVWVMGGDRDPEEPDDYAIIRYMAAGLKKGDNGNHLLTFHPQGGKSSYDFFDNDKWIDIDMSQTGHAVAAPNYTFNIKARNLTHARPHIDGEPRYEDHPNQFNPEEKGWMDDFDTRVAAYWNMLSGGAGHTYGNHDIWQMYTEKRQPITFARTHWMVALNHPGSYQVGWMRKMFEKRNWQLLEPDQTVITSDNPEGGAYKAASVSRDKDFMIIYIPYGTKTTLNTSVVKGKRLSAWWFNPRDGRTIKIPAFDNAGIKEFVPSSMGRGSDWVLIIDDASKNYPDPAVE
jgi:hypothetical protein